MKKMGLDEFSVRTREVAKAMKIFIPNITNNITEAFALYQQILAEENERMPVMVSNKDGIVRRPSSPIDVIAPSCPECDSKMHLMANAVDADGVKWNSAWACRECFAVYYSEETVEHWVQAANKINSKKEGADGKNEG